MAADRMHRMIGAEVGNAFLQNALLGTEVILNQFIFPARKRATEKLLALASEYIPFEYRNTTNPIETLLQFKTSMYLRRRACRFERMKRADQLCADFVTDVSSKCTKEPSLTAIQTRDNIQTSDGELDLRPIRLVLIEKLQRLIPEVFAHPEIDKCLGESRYVLCRAMNQLDMSGGGWSGYDKWASNEYHRNRQAADRANGDASYLLTQIDDTDDEDGEDTNTDEDDGEDANTDEDDGEESDNPVDTDEDEDEADTAADIPY